MNKKLSEKSLGVLCGALSAIFVAGYATTNKYIYGHYDISAFEYSLIFAITGGLFAALSLLSQLNRKNAQALKNNASSLLVIGLAGALAVGIFTTGQHYTTAINASLLMTSNIATTAIFSLYLLRERHSKSQYFWIAVLFGGLYLGVVGLHGVSFLKGDLIILLSALFFGFGNAYSRRVMKRMGNPRIVPDTRLTIGGLLGLFGAFFFIKDSSIIGQVLPYALLAGLFYWLCMKAFARAVFLINANNTIVLNNGQIFFTSLAGVVLLGETYSWEKFAGSVVAITAIYFIAAKNK